MNRDVLDVIFLLSGRNRIVPDSKTATRPEPEPEPDSSEHVSD